MTVTIVPVPDKSILAGLGARVRDADKREAAAFTGLDIQEAIEEAWEASYESYAARLDGATVGAWGVVSAHEPVPCTEVWATFTPDVERFSKTLFRVAAPTLRKWCRALGPLTAYVMADNVRHVRWLIRMGFRLVDAEPIGLLNGEVFLTMEYTQ